MASTFSTDLKIELIANGEQSGTWGTTTNDNFTNVFEDAIVGTGNPVFTTDANLTLTYTSTNTSQIARNLFLSVTSTVVGGLTATRSLIVPTIYKNYLVKNSTTGGQSILVKTAAGTGVTIPNGYTAFVYVDGTNVVQAFDYVPSISSINAVIAGGSINFTPIGASSPSTGVFTQVDIPAQGDLRLQDTTGGQYVAFQAPGTIPASYTLTFPDTDGNSGQVLTTDGSGVLTWTTNGAGDVTGPASSTDNAIARFDSTTGKIIKNSVVIIEDSGNTTFNSTAQIKFPAGTTAQRSGSPVDGMMRYNSDLDSFEGYVDGTWGGIGGAQAGGAIVTNKDIVSVNYTMPSGTNGMSVGPVTINSGISVTVTTNQRWVIL
jgi:hypothetical protein